MKRTEKPEVTALDIGMRAGWAAAQWDCEMRGNPEHGVQQSQLYEIADRDCVRAGLALADAHDEGCSGRAAADRAVEILRGEGEA